MAIVQATPITLPLNTFSAAASALTLHRFSFGINFYSRTYTAFLQPLQKAPTRRRSARQQLKTPNTVNVTHAEQATAEEHIITPATDDYIASASTSASHSSACRGDDQPGRSAKAAKTPRRGDLSRHSKNSSPAKGKREQDSIECTSLVEKRMASTSTSALHSSECRGDDRPGSFTKRTKIPWRGNISRRSKRASAAKRKREEETESSHRKATRNAADVAATSIRRSQETTAEKTARNAAKAAATSIRRSQESMAEKTARHAADAAANSAARASESSAQMRTRRQRDAISTSAARVVEGSTERLERLQTVNQRRHALRGLCSPPKQFWRSTMSQFRGFPVAKPPNRIHVSCNAKKWPGESAGLCCSDGKVQLPPFQELPAPLKSSVGGFQSSLQTFPRINQTVQLCLPDDLFWR
ncbi:unnamed protein product [Acanthosepion pharaonis]|uniref:Uncharacterized protein n=1 Tax=Acanthosepion pharaonis TaxID=158019 RepID=A0A812DN36_ACAPH|nr:unnamed protein product [Sepia pharaonis]